MAISSTSQTTSTYLINSSNKCIIPDLGTDTEGVPWTAYGDVDSKCLESIGFTFKEDFTEGNNIAEEEVEKVADFGTGEAFGLHLRRTSSLGGFEVVYRVTQSFCATG